MAAKTKDPKKLFDFIDIMISKPKIYNSLKAYDRGRHYFMINRFCAIQYPLQANHLQRLKINAAEAVNFWHTFLSTNYTRTPEWMYTRTSKKKNANAVKRTKSVSEDTIKEYCKRLGYARKDVYQAIEFFGDTFVKELKQFEKVLGQ